MCGRFTLRTPTPVLMETFRIGTAPDISPRYNVAPTQSVLAVRELAEKRRQREFTMMAWGLVPSWVKEPTMGSRLINARAESIAQKPSFCAAVRKRRCLIVADGYFEWKKLGARKQPYWIRLADERPFAMAGLWEAWYGPAGEESAGASSPLLSCTIVTTEANRATADIHDRMPVILLDQDWDAWLDPQQHDPNLVEHLLKPLDDVEMRIDAVSTRVNSPRNDDRDCVLVQQELF